MAKDTLFVGDTHAGVRNDSLDFMEYQLSVFEKEIIPYAIAHEIKRIVFFGDFFDKRKSTNTLTLHHFRTRVVEPLQKLGINLIFIIGNHDIYLRDSIEISTVYEFFANRYKGVYVITEPMRSRVGKAVIDFIPWVCKSNSDEILQFISKSTSDVAIGHFELTGFKFDKHGIVCEGGMSPKVLKNYKRVFSGHFHGESEQGNIKYLGTPYQLTTSDIDDPKGFYVFDDETLDVEFIQSDINMFYQVVYDEDDKVKLNIADFIKYKNTVVKLIVKNRKSKAKFNKFRDMFHQVEVLKLNIVELEDLKYDSNLLVTIAEAEDTEALISDSVASVVAADVEPTRLKLLMKDIHDRAVDRRSTL
jgi:DNA repair exonuclease SbcCD nuclease subunit